MGFPFLRLLLSRVATLTQGHQGSRRHLPGCGACDIPFVVHVQLAIFGPALLAGPTIPRQDGQAAALPARITELLAIAGHTRLHEEFWWLDAPQPPQVYLVAVELIAVTIAVHAWDTPGTRVLPHAPGGP